MEPERFDQCRLSNPGSTGDTHPKRPPAMLPKFGKKRVGLLAVIGARRLDQGDRASESTAVPGQNGRSGGGMGHEERLGGGPGRAQESENLRCCVGNIRSRSVDSADTGSAKEVVVLDRDDATANNEHFFRADIRKFTN